MGFKTTGIQWTNLELANLLEDEDSCVYLERVQKHLGLHPFHLTNLNEALREMLNAKLNFYDSELNGLLLAYRNPKILSHLGDILYDTYFIHIDIEADFYIFRPEVGRNLKGFVNKKGTNHIGILVHKAFNVSVPKPDDIENQKDWPGDKVKVGQEIKFTPDEIDYKTRLPYIRGLIYEEEYLTGCQLFNEQIAATHESEFYKITRWNNTGKCTDIKNIPKIENSRIVFNSDSEVEVDPKSESEEKSVKKLKTKMNETKESIIISPKKRKRKFSCISESELIEQNNKEVKFRIKEKENSKGQIKRHKKASSNKEAENIEEETSDKSMIINSTNESFDDSCIDKESNQLLIKQSRKRKKKLESKNIKDENEYKLEIIKSSMKNITLDDEIKIKSESDISKTKSKKRKRSSIENNVSNNVDDENLLNNRKDDSIQDKKNYKSIIISSNNQSFDDSYIDKESNELGIKQSKKRKKKLESNNIEDENQCKSKIIKSSIKFKLLKVALDNEIKIKSESDVLKTKSKKRKRSSIDHNVSNGDDEKLISNKKADQTQNEKNDKSKIINSNNQLSDNIYIYKESNESLIKQSKKRKKKLESDDIKNEEQYKSYIKSSVEKVASDDEIKIKSELEISKTQSRKPKRNSIENNMVIHVNNEKDKLSYQNSSERLITDNDESKNESIQISSKNRKKKYASSKVNDNTEDEEMSKKSMINNSSDNLMLDQSNNTKVEVSKKKSKKQKQLSMNDDTIINTEDERRYKCTLKSLVQTIQNDNIENDLEFKEPKRKKHKKKHKSSKLKEVEFEFDPEIDKIKIEPETELEERHLEKKKLKKTKNVPIDNISRKSEDKQVKEVLKKNHKKSEGKKNSMKKEEEIELKNLTNTLKLKNDVDINFINNHKKNHSDLKKFRTLFQSNFDSIIKVEKEQENKKS